MHSGRCQCGEIKISIMRDRLIAYVCHCIECQKQSASAFAVSIPLNILDISVTGKLSSYERPAASGATTSCYFCSSCGTRIYHQSSNSPDNITLKGGTINDSKNLNPIAHLWTSRKHNWINIADNIEIYEEQPDDLKLWRSKLLENLD